MLGQRLWKMVSLARSSSDLVLPAMLCTGAVEAALHAIGNKNKAETLGAKFS